MILSVVVLTNYVLAVVNKCGKEILAVFNLSGTVLLHRVSPTCRKLRKIGERVPTQGQTTISNRISQLESSFLPTEPTCTFCMHRWFGPCERKHFTVHRSRRWLVRPMGRTRYGPKHPTPLALTATEGVPGDIRNYYEIVTNSSTRRSSFEFFVKR